MVGNSLKYTSTSSTNLKSNTLWKYHQNKTDSNTTTLPSHLLLLPNDNANMLNFMNFDELGLSTVKDSTAFKKIQFFSKTNTESLFSLKSDFESNYQRISLLYNTDFKLMSSLNYGICRQHNYNSLMSSTKSPLTTLDKHSIDKYLSYNLNTHKSNAEPVNDYSHISDHSHTKRNAPDAVTSYGKNVSNYLSNKSPDNRHQSLSTSTQYPTLNSFINSETDSKQTTNTLKFVPQMALKKQKLLYKDWLPEQISLGKDTVTFNPTNKFATKLFNKEGISKFKNLKSNDMQLLSNERNPRLLGNFNSNTYTQNFSQTDNNLDSISLNLKNLGIKSESNAYNLSKLQWPHMDQVTRVFNNSVWMPTSHAP